MPRLNAAQLARRLRLDERQAAAINNDAAPITVTAHASADDAKTGRNPIPPDSTPNAPEHYRVIYAFDTLIGPDRRSKPTVVHIDLRAGGNYPFSEPVCKALGQLPWTPHFSATWPICLGRGWRNDGKQTLDDLIVHIAKLLNFDEPKPTVGYHGYNGEAIRWWRNHGYRPLDPDLRYPVIDPNGVPGAGTSPNQRRVQRVSTPGPVRNGRPRFTPTSDTQHEAVGTPAHRRFARPGDIAPPAPATTGGPRRFRPAGGTP